jgi:hypothetical protein
MNSIFFYFILLFVIKDEYLTLNHSGYINTIWNTCIRTFLFQASHKKIVWVKIVKNRPNPTKHSFESKSGRLTIRQIPFITPQLLFHYLFYIEDNVWNLGIFKQLRAWTIGISIICGSDYLHKHKKKTNKMDVKLSIIYNFILNFIFITYC